jgi:hypothetical protein
MKPHPRYRHTLEDLFLHVFVFVDDCLKANERHSRVTRAGRA